VALDKSHSGWKLYIWNKTRRTQRPCS